ncbi:hypothetical protein C8Q76DRAFT_701077 [Earliella scabrosa]|nr:hypothetical protein C8Q76DRAFT_701077 [Earliella scabrosa]
MESTLDESVEIAAAAFAIRNTSGIAFAILYYDYFLTLGAEIERFWKRPKLTLAAFGYYLNRFLSLLGHIPVIYEFYGTHTQSRCSTLQVYHQLLAGVTQLIVGALQIYRVYALYESSRRVLYTLVSLAAVACITSAWAISQAWKLGHSAGDADRSGVRERVDQRDCDLRTSEIQGKYLAIVWGTILVCDAVIFVMTVYRVLQVQRRWPGSLFTLMVRDGALYFG